MTRTGQVILATCFWSIVLAASYTLAADPTTAECLSANESSLGLRSQHKLRDARAKLLICSAPSCPADVRDECIRGVNEINAAVPTIVFEARDPTGADLGAVKVRMDGELLVESLEGTALSIDPGTHTFSFETSGQPKVEKQFLIREGEKDRRERIMFGAPAVAVAPVAGAEATPPGTTLAVSPSTTTTEPPSHGLGAQRIGALIAGGVGVVGIGIGIGYALDRDRSTTARRRSVPTRSARPVQTAWTCGTKPYPLATSRRWLSSSEPPVSQGPPHSGSPPRPSRPVAQARRSASDRGRCKFGGAGSARSCACLRCRRAGCRGPRV